MDRDSSPLLLLVISVLSVFALSCNSRRSSTSKRSGPPSHLGGVPIIPRAQNIKVRKQSESSLEVDFSVPVPRHRATQYYRIKLREEKWSVEEAGSANRTVMLARRGFYRLTLTFQSTGPGRVVVSLVGRRLSETEALAHGPPPLPKDLKLPPTILWDRRIFAAAGDDVEIRGRSRAAASKTLDQIEAALTGGGWKAQRKDPGATFLKADRKVTVRVFPLRKNLTAVRLWLNADEITSPKRAPGPDAGAALKRPKARKPAAPVDGPPDLKTVAPRKSLSKKPKEIAALKLPKGWKAGLTVSALTGHQWRYTNPSRDLARLGGELTRAMTRQGWRRAKKMGRVSFSGGVKVLVFVKRKQYLTATLKTAIEGATLDLLLAK